MADGLRLDGIRISLEDRTLVYIDTRVPPGEVLTVMGPSGTGKSTLLAFLTGTLPAAFRAEGRVRLNDRDITSLPPARRRMGLLFQDDLLFPHLSVAGNLGFGLSPGRGSDRKRRIAAALREVGLDGFGPRDPATLSGGQRARVALMRTLLSDPEALLLDEPFSRLDAGRRALTRTLVFERARDRGLPVVLVTHDDEDARAARGHLHRLG